MYKHQTVLSLLASPVLAEGEFNSINLAGTVVANNKTGPSYEARGCKHHFQRAINQAQQRQDKF